MTGRSANGKHECHHVQETLQSTHLSVLPIVEVEFGELPDGVQVLLVPSPVGGAQQFPRLPQVLRDQRLELLLGVDRVQRLEPLGDVRRQHDVLGTALQLCGLARPKSGFRGRGSGGRSSPTVILPRKIARREENEAAGGGRRRGGHPHSPQSAQLRGHSTRSCAMCCSR